MLDAGLWRPLLGSFLGRTSTNNLRLFAMLYCGALCAQILYSFRDQARYVATPDTLAPPRPLLLGRVALPTLGVVEFKVVGLCLCASLLLVCLGLWPRCFLITAIACYFLYFNQILNLGYVIRKTNVVPFILLVLLAAPGTGAPLHAPNAAWPLHLVRALLSLVYFASAVAKLRASGFGWISGGRTLQAYLLEHDLLVDAPWGRRLAERQTLCFLLSLGILLFELTFPVIVLLPGLSPVYGAIGVAFHLSTDLTMKINYLKYTGLAYPVFFHEILARWLLVP